MNNTHIIDENKIYNAITTGKANTAITNRSSHIRAILDKAMKLEGLTLDETAALLATEDFELKEEIFNFHEKQRLD